MVSIKLLSSPEVRHSSTTDLASNRTLSASTEALTSAPSSSSHQEWMPSLPALTADHSRPQHLLVGRSSKEAAENQGMGFFFGGVFFQGLRCRTWSQVKDVAFPKYRVENMKSKQAEKLLWSVGTTTPYRSWGTSPPSARCVEMLGKC